ncbi:MAG TPA: hypothetical protein VG225_08100 [Terracidiphilus sp.]|nr:hypothetical protein [Terracidiphilus sp.]
MKVPALFVFALFLAAPAQQYTRGLGVYPGDPKQYDGPSLAVDSTTYRNLALHRPAYQSSAYDYNLTAQLITDGIEEQTLPRWVVASTSDRGILAKAETGAFLDGNVVSAVNVSGDHPWVELDIEGSAPPEIDHMDISLRKIFAQPPQGGWSIAVTGSDDGATWKEVGRFIGVEFPGQHDSQPGFVEPVQFAKPVRHRMYRVAFSAPKVPTWELATLRFSIRERRCMFPGRRFFPAHG